MAVSFSPVRIPTFAACRIVRFVKPRTALVFDGLAVSVCFQPFHPPMRTHFSCFVVSAPILAVHFGRTNGYRHQRRNVSPQVIASEVPLSSSDPFLCTADVLDNQRD